MNLIFILVGHLAKTQEVALLFGFWGFFGGEGVGLGFFFSFVFFFLGGRVGVLWFFLGNFQVFNITLSQKY